MYIRFDGFEYNFKKRITDKFSYNLNQTNIYVSFVEPFSEK